MCRKLVTGSLIAMLLITGITACRKEAWDEYYGRPDTLESPIYQVLQSKGNFTHLLAAIDKAGYKNTLSGAGYWTLFAPHDSAFQVYFKEAGIAGVAQMDSITCQKIVTYCLVFNAFKKDRVDDYQSNSGWVPNTTFKRRTANYKGIYEGTNTAGAPVKAISSNRNNLGGIFWVEADNNNKHLPIFTDTFFNARAIPAADYSYFYPAASFKGFNVADGSVVMQDIPAENGVIHVINKVITPLASIDEYLSSKPDYSEFKKLFDKYLVNYVLNPVMTQRYKNLTGKSDDVYTKVYNGLLAFSPNNENYLKVQDNDAQRDGYTLFVPKNDVLLNYIQNVLLEHYQNLDQIPVNILYDFINAHMWQSSVWPSKFNNTFSYLGEPARFNATADIIDKQILSNGFFYGTNKVQEANVFSTVYSKVYLDPNYSYMNRLLDQDLKSTITNPNQQYVMLMVSNQAWNDAGYFADATVDNNQNFQWRYIPKNGGAHVVGSSALIRMLRLINQLVIPAPSNNLKTLTGSGVAQSIGGEYVRWDNNKLYTSGNMDSTVVFVANSSASKTASNGVVHYIDKLLTYTETNIGLHIAKLGTPTSSPFNSFWRYLDNSAIYNKTTGEINGIAAGVFYSVFIPNNAAILKAVNDGLLPGTGTAPNKVPNYAPTAPLDIQKVAQFIQYHILNKKSVATDGNESGSYETLLRRNNGDPTTIFVSNSAPNVMRLTDMNNEYGNVILANSNYLSNRCVIHLIDNYLKFNL
ncbi:MAG: fasciclin domain-containing protein [Bacteroidetes bacterium]|uniref:fasciclin domain-containing protein n=1 Tax=Phnomibacter sp. TaxID=2836217 RepID=UPI002FDEEF21|nr:fasciclin domain-containing protein [Bacteroidota bacterium]